MHGCNEGALIDEDWCRYGLLLRTVDRHGEAEAMYKRALDINSNHVNTLCSYGAFMHTLRNNPDDAERMSLP